MLEVRNYMEVCVEDMIDPILKRIGMCTCASCRADVAALTLNSLPTRYVALKKGQMYTRLESIQQQFEVDIIAAITKAATIVRRSPRHED
jgi:competence protein ComFB